MKQFEAKERTLNGVTFYIRPLPAFKAANISGEIFSLILPLLGSLAPLAGKVNAGEGEGLFDIKSEDAAPILSQGLSKLGGDQVEQLLNKLLIKHKNVSVDINGDDNPILLTEDLANEVLCTNVQDMYVLAFDVIQSNYSGFFGKLSSQFGGLLGELQGLIRKKPQGSTSTGS